MIYLTTGANGAGKTLNTLKTVREKQVKEGRSVYFNGFSIKPEKAAEFGWKEFDPKKWQDLPDGAILICDECQNEFPVRPSSQAVPEYVRGLSEHRRRGFDFYMITQHPQNLDMFVRRLIGSPGWHRHLKRAFGADMVSVLEWSAVNGNCEKNGAGNSARVSMVPYPKEVYEWYNSATLHTAKKSIPKQVYMLGALILVVPVLFYFGYKSLTGKVIAPPASTLTGPVAGATGAGVKLVAGPMSPADYLASYIPRLEGFPQTAPRYDELTKPVSAPYPAGCVQTPTRCQCYSQQGTKLDTKEGVCSQIVKSGYFVDWATGPTATPKSDQVATRDTAPDLSAGYAATFPPVKIRAY